MEIVREIGEKGQIVIPKDIRKFLKLENGNEIVFEIVGQEVKIRPKDNSEEYMKKFLKYQRKGKNISIKELKEIEEESYDLP